MSIHQSLISPTANPELERALRQRLERRCALAGRLGELEPLAVRLGLIQATQTPKFRDPTLVLFAADHGLAVDGIALPNGRSTREQALLALQHRLPATVVARNQGMHVTVVDCGIAEPLSPQQRLLARKIAHGTRNSRAGPAMTLDQAHAGVRVGMEISDNLAGNVIACAGLGQGSLEASALVLSRLMDMPVQDFVITGPDMPHEELSHLMLVLQGAQTRHRDVQEPMAVLAAFGGFELAVMVGAMLVAASKRQLILVDGIPAGSTRVITEAGRMQKLDELFNLLKSKRELYKQINPGKDFPGIAILQVDREVEAVIVKSVFQTAGLAGYPNISFMVQNRGGGKKKEG